MLINFLEIEPYPDCLEMFFRFALRDYVPKHKGFSFVVNGADGDIILDVKFRFANKIRKMGGTKVLYFPDLYSDYRALFNTYADNYDYLFFAANNPLIDNKRFFLVDVGYCPYTHYPIKRKKKIDVCFIGTKHKDRGWIEAIPNICIYGNEWGKGVYPVYGAKKRMITAQSKIMLNCHLDENAANMRDYEVLAMGTFLLSDAVPKELSGGMVKYNDFDDLLEKIAFYLNNEEERKKIAMRGREIVAPYTYERRCDEMLMTVIEAEAKKNDN